MDLQTPLARYFGFSSFRPGQAEALGYVLSGHDLLTVMPTGSGKSLIYQLAALMLPGTTLVISPLVALMKDQVDSLLRRHIAATFINSSLSGSDVNRRMVGLAQGRYKIVLVAPERLRSESFLQTLGHVSLKLLVVDEAHCISQWGHDFRPDYLHIADIRRRLNGQTPTTLALTATATTRVQDDIIRLLGLPSAERVVTGFNRENLKLQVLSAPDVKAKLKYVRELLSGDIGATIIYTGTRRDAEEVAEFVNQVVKIDAVFYHAGLDAESRTAIQEQFLAGDVPVIVATNAFGMGIDRPDVRMVLHYSIPGTLEAYYQEAGRAGRDGLPARAVLLHSPRDASLHEFFIKSGAPTAQELTLLHQFLQKMPDTSLEAIESGTGIREVKTRVAIQELEAAGVIHRLPADALGALYVEVKPLTQDKLAAITRHVAERQEYRRSLLSRMTAYAETNACRRRVILNYFGDKGSAEALICCDNCQARAEGRTETISTAASLSEQAALQVLDAITQVGGRLGKGRVARLLKGSMSTEVQDLKKLPCYGKLSGLGRIAIEALINQLIQAGYVKQVGADRPVVKLTPRGELARQQRAAIDVTLRAPVSTETERKQAVRVASGTIMLTLELCKQGLSPAQIAEKRAVTLSTIYSHLGQLIAQGDVDVSAVVPAETQTKIRAAIARLGSVSHLAPIKELLPPEIDYGVIRCVVEAYKREQGIMPPANQVAPAPIPASTGDRTLFEELRQWRRTRAQAQNVPAFVVMADDTLRRIAVSRPDTPVALEAIRGIGPAKMSKYADEILELVKRHVASKIESGDSSSGQPQDEVGDFLSLAHPRPLLGPWLAGWALDFHSRYDGDTANRGVVGSLVYRYKYCGEQGLAAELADRWAELLAQHPELPQFDAIVPIPPSMARPFDPVTAIAEALSARLHVPVIKDAMCKTRATRPQKEMTSLAQKRTNLAGAFALKADVRSKSILLVDDLYDSGATLNEAARVLARGGVKAIVVLTLTKTIHQDA